MNRRPPPLATGVAVGAAVVGLAASAHAIAGGALSLEPVLGAFGVVSTLAAYVARFGRWTFWRIVAAVAAAQPLLHASLGAGHDSGHAHHDAHHPAATAHADAAMVVAHIVVTLVIAVVLRWGVRWVCSLPAVARALVVSTPRPPGPLALEVGFVPAVPQLRRDLAVLAARGSRGPPR